MMLNKLHRFVGNKKKNNEKVLKDISLSPSL